MNNWLNKLERKYGRYGIPNLTNILVAGQILVLAIELFNAAQAIEFRRPAHTSPELERMLADYRKEVPFIDNDEVMYPHIEASVRFLRGL